MRIACILKGDELTSEADLIVFPEGVKESDVLNISKRYKNSIIVGAMVENGHCRGFIEYGGSNKINYLKVDSDGRTLGSNNINQMPVYETRDVCIGTLICKDIDNPDFSLSIINRINSSNARLKILCVPADMGSEWLQGDALPFPEKYRGIYFVLCNNIETHQARCKSFIADLNSKKICIQSTIEPVYVEIP